MTATYTFDVFSSLDGFGSHDGSWGAYWGKQGPQLVAQRLATYSSAQRMVFGANTFRMFVEVLAMDIEGLDAWVRKMTSMPTTVVSNSLEGPLDWPDATLVRGDVVDVVAATQGGVRRALALARQPIDEQDPDGGRPGGSHRAHHLPGNHRPDRR